ncbi:1-deoxy-D-xylulose-5-phosphate synthase [Hypnocyclicus thermotrophus]|uniref:1-deoxy-D-xylulose-5-phosphate synthase n=1 Tax=Hypnocyclicus thermotrophus TaxID=1627895 RepID=A0AA46DY53_9FUSO|nr:1-deoxy-D-xylulose-5-phosphate synthase [Hypnocyclicus thermotrophus]TDT69759.1 1-deoxy-D-xylulose-5-phosphate synthase [Hypnocyclicus thermotrophus]
MNLDIKTQNIEELEKSSQEIRELLINVVSTNGGHLGPNLGVVELTIALHKIFNSPQDKFLFDVGHQSYVHKILTGRKEKINTIRKKNGLTPFTDRRESIHDHFISGHAGNSLAAAAGIAEVNKNNKIIAIVGDASFANGENFEALNNIGGRNLKNVIIILNDNEMSIGKNVGAISKLFKGIMDTKFYNDLKHDIEGLIRKIYMGKGIADFIKKIEGSLKYFVSPISIIEKLGFKYFGPIDGNNFEKLLQILEYIKTIEGPVFLHVKTEKGKGYLHAEENKEKFHGISPFDIKTGEVEKSNKKTYSEVFGKTLVELAKKDKDIMAISAAMVKGTGLLEFFNEFSERAFDVGIAEEYAVTFSSALALEGKKPYLALYSTFLQRGYDQLIHDIAIQNSPVRLIIDRAGIVGEDGKTHNGLFDISYLLTIPHIDIVAPTTCRELVDILDYSTNINNPIAIRIPREKSFNYKGNSFKVSRGKWNEIKTGEKDLIIAIGSMFYEIINIYDEIIKNNLNPTIVSAAWIRPFDKEYILENISKYENIFVLEEGIEVTGFGANLINYLNENNILKKINKIGLPQEFIEHAKRDEILKEQGLRGQNLLNRILEGRKGGK